MEQVCSGHAGSRLNPRGGDLDWNPLLGDMPMNSWDAETNLCLLISTAARNEAFVTMWTITQWCRA
jgi:hypothetical protein